METASEVLLTPRQAYLVMFEFLHQYYIRGQSDEIGAMLGGLALMADGQPVDAVYTSDWDDAVNVVLTAEKSTKGYREADFQLKPDS